MTSNKKLARIAGLLYLGVVLTGIFNLMYVPTKLIVRGDPSATFDNITSNEILFRYGILAGLVCYLFFLALPLVLYKLLKPVNKNHAVLMVAFVAVSIPVAFVNMLNKFAVLSLVSGASYLDAFNKSQLQAQVMLYLDQYNRGILISQIFWGLWLFPFGYLVFKSGLIPRVFGILLMIGCFGYLIAFTGSFLFPNYNQTILSDYITLPGTFGEIGICLWLLIMGAKENAGKVKIVGS